MPSFTVGSDSLSVQTQEKWDLTGRGKSILEWNHLGYCASITVAFQSSIGKKRRPGIPSVHMCTPLLWVSKFLRDLQPMQKIP